MLKLIYFVPTAYVEQTKQAIFAAGAGVMHGYQELSWQILVKSSFTPTQQSQPFIGISDKRHISVEYRVETIMQEELAENVIAALIKAHPFEVVPYEITSYRQSL